MCSDLVKSPCVRNDRTKCTHCVPVSWTGALHGEWCINLHILPIARYFCSIIFAMIFIYHNDSKIPNITQFGALAGRIQHMAAQKVWFTPRPIRYGSLICRFQAQLHWNLHIRAELETCKLGEPYPRSMQIPYPFWASDNPLSLFCQQHNKFKGKSVKWKPWKGGRRRALKTLIRCTRDISVLYSGVGWTFECSPKRTTHQMSLPCSH